MTGSAGRLRTDVSLTLFLSDPAEYDGGELVISSSYGTEAVKLPAGSAITYPSNTLHRVEPVTRGTRLVVVTWIESQLRDPGQREMMYDLQNLSARLVRADANGENAQVASKTFSTLMRMWAEH
jgi:PKHD-type hydroxylase